MYTRTTAISLVEDYLNQARAYTPHRQHGPLVVLDDCTIERPYGWVFFWTSRSYARTFDRRYAVRGNGPIRFDKATGKFSPLGESSFDVDYLDNFERWKQRRAAASARPTPPAKAPPAPAKPRSVLRTIGSVLGLILDLLLTFA